MKTFEEQYSILNEQQRKAVDTTDGPVFVMAGPGTGKTQILTLRIANILKQGNGIEPENILALTFTNAASYNMRERLSAIIGASLAHRVHISTFHSFAEDMIKRYPQYFDRFIQARLISPVEQIELLHDLANEHGGESFSIFKRRNNTLKSISFNIGKVKNEGLTPQELASAIEEKFDEDMSSPDMFYKRASGENKKGDIKQSKVRVLEARKEKSIAFVSIYRAYEVELFKRSLYDYNDLINSIVKELASDSFFQNDLQEQFQYILVDEHQDTNDGQNALLHALVDNPVWEGKPNLFVVGDAKQSIFRFAGASEASFTELFEKMKDVLTIELESNYRSHQGVLTHAHSLIEKSDHHQSESELKAFFDHQGDIEYREFHNYKTEALWVASDIKRRIDEGEDPQEIAILFRNNADAIEVRTLLDVYGIAYQDLSKKNLLEDRELLKLFLLLRCVHDVSDDEIVAKSLFIDFLSFDLIDVQKILKAYKNMRAKHVSLFEMLARGEKLRELSLSDEEITKYKTFTDMILEQKGASENTDFVSFFSSFIRESGFLKALLSGPESALGLAKIETLFDEIKKEHQSRESFNVHEFISYLNTMKEHNITMNISSPMIKGVQLMTFHGSKGLEFETVYIIRALKKRSAPSEISLPLENFVDGDQEDERRLLYVAMTRAKKNCLLSSYVHNQEGKEQSRSLHINEIDMLTHVDVEQWEQEHASLFADYFGASQQHLHSLLDQEYIEDKFLHSKLSVSALNNYMESPLLYFFRNLVLLPQARSPFLEFGNLVHGALEQYFQEVKEHKEILGLPVLKESFEAILEKNPLYIDHQERAWEILSSYFINHKESFDIPLENEFRVPAVSFDSDIGHSINLTGVIDKVTKTDDGHVVVWDYKTGRAYSDMDKSRKEKLKRQATFYKLLLQYSFDGRYNPQRVTFDFIEPSKKTGEFERHSFEISQEDVDVLKQEINELVADIFSGTLLDRNFSLDQKNRELLDFLEVLKGPHTFEQPSLLS